MGWGQRAPQARVLFGSHTANGAVQAENKQPCVCTGLSLPFTKQTFNPMALLTLQTTILVLGFSSGPG